LVAFWWVNTRVDPGPADCKCSTQVVVQAEAQSAMCVGYTLHEKVRVHSMKFNSRKFLTAQNAFCKVVPVACLSTAACRGVACERM